MIYRYIRQNAVAEVGNVLIHAKAVYHFLHTLFYFADRKTRFSSRRQSVFTPDVLMTFDHFASSFRMRLANCSGEL